MAAASKIRNMKFFAGKSSDVSEFCGSAPTHPVRCPVTIFSFPLKNKHRRHTIMNAHCIHVDLICFQFVLGCGVVL